MKEGLVYWSGHGEVSLLAMVARHICKRSRICWEGSGEDDRVGVG